MKNTPRRTPLRAAQLTNTADAGSGQLFDVALSIVAISLLGLSTAQLGILNALGTISFLVLAVPFGALVDRIGPARVLLASLGLKLAIIAITIVLFAASRLDTASVMVVTTAIGVVTVATENAMTTVVPRLTTAPGRIAQAVAAMTSVDRAAGIVCPGIAGLLVAHWGGLPALGVAGSLAAFAVIAALPVLRRTRHESAPHDGRPTDARRLEAGRLRAFWVSAGHGFAVIFADRTLLGVVLLTAAGNVGLAIGDSVQAVLILRTLHLGAAFFGLLGTIAAASGLGAALFAPRVARRVQLRLLFGFGAVAQAAVACLPLLAYLARPLAPGLLVAFSVLWALVLTLTNVAGASYRAFAVPAVSLGRASAAARTLTMGSVPVAAVVGGILGSTVGIGAPLVVWPVVTIVAALAFFPLAPCCPVRE